MNKVNFWKQFQETRFIGFDLDNTLIQYKIQNLAKLLFECIQNYLVKEPNLSNLKECVFNPKICAKGNIIDFEKGNILKLDEENKITIAFHGSKRLSNQDIMKQYDNGFLKSFTGKRDEKFLPLATEFGIGLGSFVASLIDLFDQEIKKGNDLKYSSLANHLYSAMDRNFVEWENGQYFRTIEANPTKYVIPSPKTRLLLEKLIENKKELFVVTNSIPEYTRLLLDVCIGKDWRKFFKIIVYSSSKPRFFNLDNPFEICLPENEDKKSIVEFLHGNFKQLENELKKLTNPKNENENEKFCYFGDHLISDIQACKLNSNWITTGIISELNKINSNEHEIWGNFFYCKESLEESKTEDKKSFWKLISDKYCDYVTSSLEDFYNEYQEFLNKKN
ncbi:5'-nucleotidase domain-containing protein [Anaeramoeba ignava]|uniref:5'-nucleotidase domain-containing protein n=1 Tax=Anaeramoeba ignava TaxID=1746090 RepID=A0A9Q0LD13_ANAIG|nr:5'-nucleotidase domain-containing protein [Anaeramoeba ignava]